MWAKRVKDKAIRYNYNKKELGVLPLLFLLNNCTLEPVYRFSLSKKLARINKSSFKTQIKNRCVLSLRSRSPIKSFRLSRVAFRALASNGGLIGIKKSSW